MIEHTGTVLLGRIGYQEWAGYWPDVENGDPFGSFINPVEKLVASRTLSGDLKWQNSRLIDGDLEDFVAALRQTDGGAISVCGSTSVVRQLFLAGLLDTLKAMVHPVIVDPGGTSSNPAIQMPTSCRTSRPRHRSTRRR